MKRTIKGTDLIYQNPGNVFDAFQDITEKIGTGIFSNIRFDSDEGILTYDVYGEHQVERVFDMEQGTPELITDMLHWFFSMLDGIANM